MSVPSALPLASTEIFRSPDLFVTKDLRRHASVCCVAILDSYTNDQSLDRPGFGEVIFGVNGIAIHIIPRGND